MFFIWSESSLGLLYANSRESILQMRYTTNDSLSKLGIHSSSCFVIHQHKQTRMHSRRMRTARLWTISQHALPGGVPAWGCTCLGVYLPGGVPAWGGVPARGGTCPGTPPTVNRMTDRCKNITFAYFVCGR